MFYDVVYQRYGSPMELLDNMLDTGRLAEFVSRIIDTVCDEREEKQIWEFWLHKDFKRSWKECMEALDEIKNHKAAPTQKETAEIVKDSMEIMASFCLAGGGAEDGAIQTIRGDSDRRDEGEQNP